MCLRLDRLGIFGINLLEFCFPLITPKSSREGLQVKARPFRVLYDYWYAGGLARRGQRNSLPGPGGFCAGGWLETGRALLLAGKQTHGQIYKQNSGQPLPKPHVFFTAGLFPENRQGLWRGYSSRAGKSLINRLPGLRH